MLEELGEADGALAADETEFEERQSLRLSKKTQPGRMRKWKQPG